MDKIKQAFSKSMMLWATLKGWQKLSVLLAALGVIAMLAFMVFMGRAPAYEPLYSGLDLEDQGAMVTYLRENNIPYRLESGTNAILLPADRVHEAKLALAAEGLPAGGIDGWELFDDSSMGMSEFQQKISYVRALEGELTRTINLIDAVDSSKVSIVLPQQRLFLEQQTPSSASVLLRLRSGFQVRPEQVKAVIKMVSSSVQGLLPENVTVIDTLGNDLSAMIEDDLFIRGGGRNAITSLQRELELQRETRLESEVKRLLGSIHGPGKVAVTVAVDLNFDKRSNTLTEYIPNPETGRGVVRSNQNMEENYTGTGGVPGGAPGTTTNIPGYAINTQNVNSEYSKTEATNNYEITTRESTSNETPGSIRRLTAAVVIDGQLDEERLNGARELVAAAIGLNEARGDNLVVRSEPFSTELKDALDAQLRQERIVSIVVTSSIGLVLLALGLLLAFLWWKRRKAMLAMMRATSDAKHIPTIQEMLTSPDMIAAQGEISVLEEQLKAYARSNPKEVANLINEWLSED